MGGEIWNVKTIVRNANKQSKRDYMSISFVSMFKHAYIYGHVVM